MTKKRRRSERLGRDSVKEKKPVDKEETGSVNEMGRQKKWMQKEKWKTYMKKGYQKETFERRKQDGWKKMKKRQNQKMGKRFVRA